MSDDAADASTSPTDGGSDAANHTWQRERSAVLARVEALQLAVTALLDGTLDADARRQAERTAYEVAGDAEAFGFAEASRIARTIVQRLIGHHRRGVADGVADRDDGSVGEVVDVVDIHALAALVGELREAFGPADVRGDAAPDPSGANDDVVVVDCQDPGLGRALLEGLAAEGLAAVAWDPIEPPINPRALLVQLRDDGSRERLVLALPPGARTTAVALVDPHCPDDRMFASRVGAHLILDETLAGEEVVAALQRRLGDDARAPDGATVVVVVDDPFVHDAFRALAHTHGWSTVHVADPSRLSDEFVHVTPDLIVVDVDMPDVDEIMLARAVRGDPRYTDLPIVFLTVSDDRATIARIFAAGADDFLVKPIDPAVGAVRLSRFIDRGRDLGRTGDVDPATGLASRDRFVSALDARLAALERLPAPLSLAVIHVDGLRDLDLGRGPQSIDDVMRVVAATVAGDAEGDDLTSRLASSEIALAMPGTTDADATSRLQVLIAEMRASGLPDDVRVVATVAAFPDDAVTASGLIAVARRALPTVAARGEVDRAESASATAPARRPPS